MKKDIDIQTLSKLIVTNHKTSTKTTTNIIMSEFALNIKATLTDLISKNKHFQFSADWCPDCQYANSIWTKYDITEKLFIFDIGSFPKPDQEKWRATFQEITGSRNLPTIMVDGKIWGTEKELHEHENNGTLEAELKNIGLL